MAFFGGMDGVGYGYVNGVVFGNIHRKAVIFPFFVWGFPVNVPLPSGYSI